MPYIYSLVTCVHLNCGVHTCIPAYVGTCMCAYQSSDDLLSNQKKYSQMTTPVPDTSVVQCVWPEGRDIGSL